MSRMRSSIGVGRRSSLSNADAKRSSVGGARAVVKDPRPILDKGYVKEGITYLSAFLRERGFEGACTPKELKQPSTPTVFNIFKFLLLHLLPQYTMAKLDEVPQLLIALGYPCKMNKSWLTAVGSPHAWPHLLAALQWICHCIEASELTDMYQLVFASEQDEMTMFPGDPEGVPPKQRRHEFHAESYASFMQDGDVNLETSHYKQQCDLKENRLIQAIRDIDANTDTCQQAVEQATSEPSPLQQIQKQVNCCASDTHKFEVLIQQLKEHVQQQTVLGQQKVEQLHDEERIYQALEVEKEQLQRRVASQPLSSMDVQRLAAESEQLCSERRDLRQKLDNLEKEKWQMELDSNKLATHLNSEKQTILTSGFDLDTHTFAALQEQLLVEEDGLRRQRMTLQDEMERLQQMAQKQQEFVSTLENDLKLSQATHRRNLQQLSDEYQRELSRSEQFRNALHSRLESKGEGQRLADAQDSLRQAQNRLEEAKVRCTTELEEKDIFLKEAMSKIVQHLEMYTNRVIARLEQ